MFFSNLSIVRINGYLKEIKTCSNFSVLLLVFSLWPIQWKGYNINNVFLDHKTNVVNSFQHLKFTCFGKRLGPICTKRSEIWGANSSGPSWFGIHGTRRITYLVILAGNERSWEEKRLPTFTSIEKQWSYSGFYFCNVSLARGCISMALWFIWILKKNSEFAIQCFPIFGLVI